MTRPCASIDGVATLEQKIRCEIKFRDLARESGLPEPDVVEYEESLIRAIWIHEKVALEVEIDGDPER